jgi:hypothetical protein
MNKYQINYKDLQTQEYKKHIIESRRDVDAIRNFRGIFSMNEAQIVVVKKLTD